MWNASGGSCGETHDYMIEQDADRVKLGMWEYFLLCENAFVGGECSSDVMGGWSLINVNEIIKLRPLEAHPPRKFELWLKWTIYMGLINIGVFRHFNLKNDYELNISAFKPCLKCLDSHSFTHFSRKVMWLWEAVSVNIALQFFIHLLHF